MTDTAAVDSLLHRLRQIAATAGDGFRYRLEQFLQAEESFRDDDAPLKRRW